MDFGFTVDAERVPAVRRWVAAAVADGWNIKPTYPGIETIGRAASLEREGFKVMAIAREMPDNKKWKGEAKVSAWGPDGLAIKPPNEYTATTFAELKAGLRKCLNGCGKEDVSAQRVGFAGRVCAECLPAARKKYEFPGWCD